MQGSKNNNLYDKVFIMKILRGMKVELTESSVIFRTQFDLDTLESFGILESIQNMVKELEELGAVVVVDKWITGREPPKNLDLRKYILVYSYDKTMYIIHRRKGV